MFHFTLPLFGRRKPAPLPHVEIRYIAATKHENGEARLRRETVANDLRCVWDKQHLGETVLRMLDRKDARQAELFEGAAA